MTTAFSYCSSAVLQKSFLSRLGEMNQAKGQSDTMLQKILEVSDAMTKKINGMSDEVCKDIQDNILEKVIGCMHHEKDSHDEVACDSVCTEAFKVLPDELQFYKRMDLPIPRLCPNCRHASRLKQAPVGNCSKVGRTSAVPPQKRRLRSIKHSREYVLLILTL